MKTNRITRLDWSMERDAEFKRFERAIDALSPDSFLKILRIGRLLSAELKAPAKPFTSAYNTVMDDPTLCSPEKMRAIDLLLASLPS